MATYLDGVEDGRRDVLIRIEREAVATLRDMWAEQEQRRSALQRQQQAKLSVLINLIKGLSDQPVSWQAIYERVEAKANELHEQAKLAGAQVVS